MHNFYHYPGLTDLSKIRDDAGYRRTVGYMGTPESSVIHHHSADENCTLGQPDDTQTHEIFKVE